MPPYLGGSHASATTEMGIMGGRGPKSPPIPGSRFDTRWEILAHLGSGETSHVVAARHDYGLEAALKVLHPHLAEDDELRRRFVAQ
ncbi:MAG: hypothetical protein JNM74_17485, partial [Myxococcales bacterium]|nr:hypothetical protein [Myxococcales bacterium]